MRNIKNPYNNFFEFVTQNEKEIEQLLLHFTDDLAKHLEVGSLRSDERTFVDEHLREHLTDRVFIGKYRGQEAFFNILLEHKSSKVNVADQLFRYLSNGYQRQLQEHHKLQEERKAADLPTVPFKRRLIIPVLLYHGERPYTYRTYAAAFQLPHEDLRKYIPNFDYIVIDLNRFSDDYIEAISGDVLKVMLLLFKHKGDTNYFRRNVEKIIKFVVQARNQFAALDLFKAFLIFIYNTFNLNQDDMSDMTAKIPSTYKSEFKTTADRLRQEGYMLAVKEMKTLRKWIEKAEEQKIEAEKQKAKAEEQKAKAEEQKAKAEEQKVEAEKQKVEAEKQKAEAEKQKAEAEKQAEKQKIQSAESILKHNIELTLNLINRLPDFKDEDIANINKLEPSFVKQLRNAFTQKEEVALRKFIHNTFKSIPKYSKKDLQNIEKWGIKLWQEFHYTSEK